MKTALTNLTVIWADDGKASGLIHVNEVAFLEAGVCPKEDFYTICRRNRQRTAKWCGELELHLIPKSPNYVLQICCAT